MGGLGSQLALPPGASLNNLLGFLGHSSGVPQGLQTVTCSRDSAGLDQSVKLLIHSVLL